MNEILYLGSRYSTGVNLYWDNIREKMCFKKFSLSGKLKFTTLPEKSILRYKEKFVNFQQ